MCDETGLKDYGKYFKRFRLESWERELQHNDFRYNNKHFYSFVPIPAPAEDEPESELEIEAEKEALTA